VKVVSINVGRPRPVSYRGTIVHTGIFKTPRTGSVRVGPEHLDGDEQADLRVHGGVHKAVYAYPSEHYGIWRDELPGVDLPWGIFGENLTVEGLLETDVRVGDRLQIGTAEFVVTRPRMPCFKLGIRFGRADMVTRFWHAGRPGFYLAIGAEGVIESGDRITILPGDPTAPTIASVFADATAEPVVLPREVM
jgi:MOSC domain-containing protein YiiM